MPDQQQPHTSQQSPAQQQAQTEALFEEARNRVFSSDENDRPKHQANLQEASKLLEKAIAINPTADMHFLLGGVYCQLHRTEEGKKALTIAAETGDGERAAEARKYLRLLQQGERRGNSLWFRLLKIVATVEDEKAERKLYAHVNKEKYRQEFLATSEPEAHRRFQQAEQEIVETSTAHSMRNVFVFLGSLLVLFVINLVLHNQVISIVLAIVFYLFLFLCFLGAAWGIIHFILRIITRQK